MDMPILLKNEIEKLAVGYKQSQLVIAAQSLTEKYKNESGQGKHLVSKDVDTTAYAIVRMPATYGAVSSALEYTLEYYADTIESVIDVGAGTGTASWAVSALFDSIHDYTCIEREDSMISIGKKLMVSNTNFQHLKWIRQDYASSPIIGQADLVIASYALNELSDNDRIRVLNELWKATKKLLIIVEPGTPVGYSQLRMERKYLIDLGGFVVAPCVGNTVCPISENDWCHFTCRVQRSKLHKLLKGGDAPYEDEKFSFIAISKEKTNCAKSRILRHPIIEPGRITLQLCTGKTVETKIITKKDGDLFKKARKSNCGDAWQ